MKNTDPFWLCYLWEGFGCLWDCENFQNFVLLNFHLFTPRYDRVDGTFVFGHRQTKSFQSHHFGESFYLAKMIHSHNYRFCAKMIHSHWYILTLQHRITLWPWFLCENDLICSRPSGGIFESCGRNRFDNGSFRLHDTCRINPSVYLTQVERSREDIHEHMQFLNVRMCLFPC